MSITLLIGILEVCEDEPKPMQKVQKVSDNDMNLCKGTLFCLDLKVHTEEKMHTLMTSKLYREKYK